MKKKSMNTLKVKNILSIMGDWYISLTNAAWTLFGVSACLIEALWCINKDNNKAAMMSIIMAFCMVVISRGGVLTNDMNPDSLEQAIPITLFPIFGLYTSTAFISEAPNLLEGIRIVMWLGWANSAISLVRLANNKLADHRSFPVLLSYIGVVLLALSILLK